MASAGCLINNIWRDCPFARANGNFVRPAIVKFAPIVRVSSATIAMPQIL